MNVQGPSKEKKKSSRKGKGVLLKKQDARRTRLNNQFVLTFDELMNAYFDGRMSSEEYQAQKRALLSGTYTPTPCYQVSVCAKTNNVDIARVDLVDTDDTSSVLINYGPQCESAPPDTFVHEIDVIPYVEKINDIEDGILHLEMVDCPLREEQTKMTIGELQSHGYIDEDISGEDSWLEHYSQRSDDRALSVKHAIYHDLPRAYEQALIQQFPLFEDRFRGQHVPIPRVVFNALRTLHAVQSVPIVDLANGRIDTLRSSPRLTYIPQRVIEWPLICTHVASPFDVRRYNNALVLFDPVGNILINGNVCLHSDCEYIANNVETRQTCSGLVCVTSVSKQEEFEDAVKTKRSWHLIVVGPASRLKIVCNTVSILGN